MDLTVWALWLPIVVSGVVVFIASCFAWMVLPHHRSDWSKLPDEEGFQKSLGDLNVAPGDYMFPGHESSEEMKSAQFQQKWQAGPRGLISVWPEAPNMGLQIGKTFVFYLFASFTVGYLASMGVRADASRGMVFRFVATSAIVAYCFALFPGAIWFRRHLVKDVLDGVVYALLTGLVFTLLWPGGS
ncbi:MAG: hypothetical protein OES79_15345 [Planctomycetota bacterium]|nr:hypothetical protein [Planctomycetota bacterium]